jgi:hypothetical protein
MRKGEPVCGETGDGHGVTLVATDAGLAAIGIEPKDAHRVCGRDGRADRGARAGHRTEPKAAPKAYTPREGTMRCSPILGQDLAGLKLLSGSSGRVA